MSIAINKDGAIKKISFDNSYYYFMQLTLYAKSFSSYQGGGIFVGTDPKPDVIYDVLVLSYSASSDILSIGRGDIRYTTPAPIPESSLSMPHNQNIGSPCWRITSDGVLCLYDNSGKASFSGTTTPALVFFRRVNY